MPDKPIPKPYTAEQFKKSADTLLQGIYGTGPSSNDYLIGLIQETLDKIKSLGAQTGIALNPGTSADAIKPFIQNIDLVLIMTVWPGFGGQSFIEDTLEKMATINQWRIDQNLDFRLEVDGGINLETAKRCAAQGVDTFVAGTAFFKSPSLPEFREAIEN